MLARLAPGEARVVAAILAPDGRLLADVRTGAGSPAERRLVREDGAEASAVDPVLADVPALVGPLRRLVRVRELFDLRWLDKGSPVEPHAVCLIARGDRVAVHVEHRDPRTWRVVPSWPQGVLLVLDDELKVRSWRRLAAFRDAVHAV